MLRVPCRLTEIVIEYVPLGSLIADKNNPRKKMAKQGLEYLKRSIRVHGLAWPLVVTLDMLVIDGHRRLVCLGELYGPDWEVPVVLAANTDEGRRFRDIIHFIPPTAWSAYEKGSEMVAARRDGTWSMDELSAMHSGGEYTVKRRIAAVDAVNTYGLGKRYMAYFERGADGSVPTIVIAEMIKSGQLKSCTQVADLPFILAYISKPWLKRSATNPGEFMTIAELTSRAHMVQARRKTAGYRRGGQKDI